jgi:hypothetical protein
MKKLAPLCLALALLVPSAQIAAKDAASDPVKLGHNRFAAAHKVVMGITAVVKTASVDADTVYRWSVRELDAQLEEAADAKEIGVAFEEHLKRMRSLREQIQVGYDKGGRNALEMDEASYYVAEAELWKARSKK